MRDYMINADKILTHDEKEILIGIIEDEIQTEDYEIAYDKTQKSLIESILKKLKD